MYNIRETKNSLEAEPFLIESGAAFTQSHIYAGWQSKREIRRFVIEENDRIVAFFQAIKFPLIFGKSYYYIPYGPVVREYSVDLIEYLRQNISLIKDRDVVFVRFDFSPVISDEKVLKHLDKFFYKVPNRLFDGSHFQPRQEWFLNLEKSEETLLREMDKKTRYAIRTAETKGVQVRIIETNFMKHFSDFYRLMQVTAERGHFKLHPRNYYENIFTNLDKENRERSFLSIAYLGEEILVIDLVVVFGKVALYLFSGSSNENRNLTPAYLAQWQSIIQAKKLGCFEYNFGGVSLDKGNHKKDWAGFTDYKIKFGGRAVIHSDFYDVIFKHLWYFMYILRKFISSIRHEKNT